MRERPEQDSLSLQTSQASFIPQDMVVEGPNGLEKIFLQPVSQEIDGSRQRLVFEGETPETGRDIRGRMRVDYFSNYGRKYHRKQVFTELEEGNKVLNQLEITCPRGLVDIKYVINGSMLISPRMGEVDPSFYDFYIVAQFPNKPLNYPLLASMDYGSKGGRTFPYWVELAHGEFDALAVGNAKPEEINAYGKKEIYYRKLLYLFGMGRGWRVLDEKAEYQGVGVPRESFRDVIANRKRLSRVQTSPYSFRVKQRDTWGGQEGKLELHRFNRESKSLWVFSAPLWLDKEEVLRGATFESDDLDQSVTLMANFIYNSPVSLTVKEKGKPELKFAA